MGLMRVTEERDACGAGTGMQFNRHLEFWMGFGDTFRDNIRDNFSSRAL